MNEGVIWGLAGMAFVVLILAIFVIPIAKIAQTKIQTAKEEVYQKLAIDAVEAQKETNRLNEKLLENITEVKNGTEGRFRCFYFEIGTGNPSLCSKFCRLI